MLQESVFGLVPHGYIHPETYRLYECLESGCIPIIENPHHFFDRFIPGNPFIKINLWIESHDIIINLCKDNDKDKLKKMSQEIYIWWENYKEKLNQNFKDIINV